MAGLLSRSLRATRSRPAKNAPRSLHPSLHHPNHLSAEASTREHIPPSPCRARFSAYTAATNCSCLEAGAAPHDEGEGEGEGGHDGRPRQVHDEGLTLSHLHDLHSRLRRGGGHDLGDGRRGDNAGNSLMRRGKRRGGYGSAIGFQPHWEAFEKTRRSPQALQPSGCHGGPAGLRGATGDRAIEATRVPEEMPGFTGPMKRV